MDQASSSETSLIIKMPWESSLRTQSLSDFQKPNPIHLMGSRTLQIPNSPQVISDTKVSQTGFRNLLMRFLNCVEQITKYQALTHDP